MKDNTLRELTPKELIRKEVSDFYINILGYCVEPEDEYSVELATEAIEALLAEEVRKVKIEELELILNGYGWGEGEEAANFIIKDRIAELEKGK